MVNAVPEFTDQPKVINGCSDLFLAVLGERGRHARSAVGMGSLPMQISVEIEAVMRNPRLTVLLSRSARQRRLRARRCALCAGRPSA